MFIRSPKTMFSVLFRRRVRVHVRRNDFCFSCQNRSSKTLDIWDKESIDLGKCTRWQFWWPSPKVTAVTSIKKIALPNSLWKFLKCFLKGQTLLDISQEWFVRLMWNEKGVHRFELFDLDLWPHPWPWPCSLKVKIWDSLIWGVRALIVMERKGCESTILDHDRDL